MAKRSFSAEAFNEAAGKVASGDTGEYPVISRGTYIANLAKVFFEIKDSGAEMVNFGFQIDSEDDDFSKLRDLLLQNSDLLEEFNQLKTKFEGKQMEDYRKEKGRFFDRLRSM